MRKYLLPLLAATLLLGVAAPAPAAAAPGPTTAQTQQARLGGFRGARPGLGSRARSRPSYRPRSRSRPRTHLFRGILQALGLAYLFHLLFGWGPGGGSPFGLLIVLAFVAWLVTRRRARVRYP